MACREWEPCQPDGGHDGQSDEHRGPDAPAGDPLQRRGERPRLPHEEREDGDLGSDRAKQQEPGASSIVVDPRELGGGEEVARVEVRKRELWNLGSPEDDRRADPERRQRDECEALR